MSIRQPDIELARRMEAKSLDSRFLSIITLGLDCSPFEANAILDALREVYGPCMQGPSSGPVPGQVCLVAVDAAEPSGKPLKACATRTVTLSLHRGAQDEAVLREQGPAAFRRSRIPDLLEEALAQGALLTREDLALRVFHVGLRTVSRDLAVLRAQPQAPCLPLRGTVHDIGPVITHRVQVVEMALKGRSQLEICRALRHSPEAVSNYLSTFCRIARLAARGLPLPEIAYLVQRGETLAGKYLDLWRQASAPGDPRAVFLQQMLAPGSAAPEKPAAQETPEPPRPAPQEAPAAKAPKAREHQEKPEEKGRKPQAADGGKKRAAAASRPGRRARG